MSMEWKHVYSPPPKETKVQKSEGKVILSDFWDCHGVNPTDYLPMGRNISGTYYSNPLEKLRVALKNKRRGMLSRGIRLLADSAPAHSSQVAVDKSKSMWL